MNLFENLENELSNIEGVDGFAVLSSDAEIEYSNLKPDFLLEKQDFMKKCIEKLNISGFKRCYNGKSGQNNNGQLILLSEKAVFCVTSIDGKYLFIIAGTKELVDVSKLSRIKDKIVR